MFHFDEQFEDHEREYDAIRREILAEESDGENEEEAGATNEQIQDHGGIEIKSNDQLKIEDQTDMANAALRRTLYLTIMSSASFEECAHKIMKIKMKSGDERIVCKMILECCMQERTFLRFFGLLGERFCQISSVYRDAFDDMFAIQYVSIHHLETGKLRNVAKLFAHLLHSDALDWGVLEYIHLNESETTSSSRIFVKILFQELSEYMGLMGLKKRMEEPSLQEAFQGLFPQDNPKDTRFSINFFTSIGLGGLTETMRKWLKEQQRLMFEKRNELVQQAAEKEEKKTRIDSSSDSELDSNSSDSSSAGEREEDRGRYHKRSKRNT